jgi:release factor glutamine methyltransferase
VATIGALLAGAVVPRGEAAMLLAAAMGVDRVVLVAHPEREVEPVAAERFGAWAERRARGEPIAYLLERREFYGLALRVTPAVLIPRPETELVVDRALALGGRRVLDMGTGSGAIAIAIAKHAPAAEVWAVDASDAALAVARENARANSVHVRFILSDWFAALGGEQFDLVVANPPYVAAGDPHLARGDLRFEPAAALAAGPDGLDAIRAIVRAAPAHLSADGALVLEHGFDQAPAVQALLAAAGFTAIASTADLAGHLRTTEARKPGSGTNFHDLETTAGGR